MVTKTTLHWKFVCQILRSLACMAGSQVICGCTKEQEVLCTYVCMSVVAISTQHKPIGKTRMIHKELETGSELQIQFECSTELKQTSGTND